MVSPKKFDYRFSGLQVCIRDSFIQEFVELEERLGNVYRSSIVSTEELLKKSLDQLREIGEEYASRAHSPEDQLCVKRTVLDFEYSTILKSVPPSPVLLEKIVRQLEQIGFDYPTRWADMWLEVAHQNKRIGKLDEARDQCRKVITDLTALKKQVDSLLEYAQNSKERL